MTPDWTDLGPLASFPEDAPVLRKDERGRRYACVREGDCVHAIDDRCPHQGYPLSQGTVREGVLTCEWHNWKFDLASGGCTFGGEPVRRYPTRIEGGRVHLDRAVDRGAEARRLTASLRQALARDDAGRALREALRLGDLGIGLADAGLGRLSVGFELLALDGAERGEYGFDHGLALLADLLSWVERGVLGGEEAFVLAARAVAEPSLHLGPRAAPRPQAALRASLATLSDVEVTRPARVAEALAAERRDEAEALVRAVVESRGPAGALEALLPFVSRNLLDYGHGAIFLTKALELGRRFPAAATEIAASVTTMLAWATADTSLPPFTATREAIGRASEMTLPAGQGTPLADRRAYEEAVLAGEREAVKATLDALGAGADPTLVLYAVAHAAARRVARFDSAWERRLDAEVSVLDVTHAVTFAEAAITLAKAVDGTAEGSRHAARLAVIGAGFVGKLRRADAAEPCAATRASGTLAEAAAARDVGRALALAAGMDGAARREAYREIAPFAALDAAVRPIFYAHTVKMTEALRRLEEGDAQADGTYLEALLSYVVPVRPEGRARRIAAVARKFLEDGRPPEGLY
jgi:nitrite reductase/ring-hydroxylating ferredoxin subunit